MRIRQVKPSFWGDSTLAELPRSVRLTYIGLWMIADDGGWFRENIPEIARELYGYEDRKRRERSTGDDLQMLENRGRILRLPCGHDYIPKMTEHQRLSGATKQVHTIEREHEKCVMAGKRGDPHTPARKGIGQGEDTVSSVKSSDERASDGVLKSRVEEYGFDASKIGHPKS